MIDINGTRVDVLDQHPLTELPADGHLTTVTVTIPPNDPGTPAHRHSGPVVDPRAAQA